MKPQPLLPSRAPKKASLEKEVIYPILDEALFCIISYVQDGLPFSIPTSFVRHEDKIYIHGSVGSHFIRSLETGIPVCITVMLVDALVVARSAFSHSVNYKSVVVFATGEKIESPDLKWDSLEWLTEKIVPGSWDYLRPMSESEVRKTTVLAFSLDQASAKARTGMPNDEEEDRKLEIWSGIIPLEQKRLAPIADDHSQHIALPKHLR